jgi:hypothetical protein
MADPDDVEAMRGELEELRRRTAELEAESRRGEHRGRNLRSIAAVVLIVVGLLCFTLAPLAIWARNLVLDTNHYVDTVKPIASDPGLQNLVVERVDKQVNDHLDVRSLLDDVLSPRAARALSGPLQSAASALVTTITTRFVQSDAFKKLWVEANRAAHQQIRYVLTGSRTKNAAVQLNSNGAVVLHLDNVVTQVKDRLVSAGLTVAKSIPPVGGTIEIAQLKGLERARRGVSALNRIADWLPWIGLVLVGGGIATAHHRRRALTRTALGLALGMIVIGIGVLIGREFYLNGVSGKIPGDTAERLFDTVVRYLHWGIRLVFLLSLLVALVAWVSGPTNTATKFRNAVAEGPRRLGAQLNTGEVGTFVANHVNVLRVGIIAVAIAIFLFIDQPSVATVILLAVIAVVLLLVVELLRASAAGRHAT